MPAYLSVSMSFCMSLSVCMRLCYKARDRLFCTSAYNIMCLKLYVCLYSCLSVCLYVCLSVSVFASSCVLYRILALAIERLASFCRLSDNEYWPDISPIPDSSHIIDNVYFT